MSRKRQETARGRLGRTPTSSSHKEPSAEGAWRDRRGMWEGPPRLPGSPHPHHWPSGTFLPANTTAVVQGDPGGSTECVAHKVLHGHVCRKRARSAPGKAASLGQGRGLRREPGGATAGSADTTFSEPSEAGAPDKCPMPTAACPARAQGQHPRGTDGWRNCRSSDKQHQSHPSEKHASGRGTSCVLRTAPGITGRGPRAGSQIGLCRQTAPAQRWEPSLTTVQGPAERVGAALRPAPRARDKGPGPWWALPQSPRREEEGSWE